MRACYHTRLRERIQVAATSFKKTIYPTRSVYAAIAWEMEENISQGVSLTNQCKRWFRVTKTVADGLGFDLGLGPEIFLLKPDETEQQKPWPVFISVTSNTMY